MMAYRSAKLSYFSRSAFVVHSATGSLGFAMPRRRGANPNEKAAPASDFLPLPARR